MGRKQKQDWDVRTNISATPGAQGTLFSGGKKYASDKRYPRGYTPERLADVKDSVDTSNVSVSWGQQRTLEALHGTQKAPYVGDFGEPNRKLIDGIARSTVPTDHLLYTDADRQKDDVIRFTTGHERDSLGQNVAGHYVSRQLQAKQGAGSNTRPVIAVTKGFEDTPTTIHEIGHHVDSEERGYHYHSHSNPVGVGAAEGRADAYADTHYRDRSGRPGKIWNYDSAVVYPGEGQQTAQRRNDFTTGYLQGRHTGLQPAPAAKPHILDSLSDRGPEGQGLFTGTVGVDHDTNKYKVNRWVTRTTADGPVGDLGGDKR